jgi:hypothetical protein
VADRRALVVGSWLAKGRDRPSPQRVRSITDRWKGIFKENRYGFRGLKRTRAMPTILHNPMVRDLIDELTSASKVTDDTELLFYFLGHSVSVGENDIRLILGLGADEEDRSCSLTWLLDTIYDQTRIRKLVIILDTCHAGRTRQVFRPLRENSFAMFGTGDAYAFDANFSDGLLRALEQPIHKNDQRIDLRAGGMTYQKIFEDARRRVISRSAASDFQQDPRYFGDHGGELLLKAPLRVPDEFNAFASSRSIYGRVFRLLEIVRDKRPTLQELLDAVRDDPVFLLRRNSAGRDRYLSRERLNEYLDFLRKANWVVQPKGRFGLTSSGRDASNTRIFNKAMRDTIENRVLSEGISFDFLDEIVRELLNDMIPPTPIRIKDRIGMKGKMLRLDVATRVAIQLLPSTGRFLKGAADAIYPSELGG